MPVTYAPAIVGKSTVRKPTVQSTNQTTPSTTSTPKSYKPPTPNVSQPTDLIVPSLAGAPGPTTVTQPTTPAAPTQPDTSASLNEQLLSTALAQIEAQYGLSREQLLASRTAIGDEYRFMELQLQKAREQALEQVGYNAQERGITRSGIYAENVADTETEFANQLSQAESAFQSQDEQIASQLAALSQQEELARLEAERTAKLRALDQEVLRALAEAGL